LARILFQGRQLEADGRSLLDCLVAAGHEMSSGCRAGVCQSCLVRVLAGRVPEAAQQGLAPAQVARGLVLACQCRPQEDLEVATADEAVAWFDTQVLAVEPLNADTCELRLERPAGYEYHAGQFLQLVRDVNTARCYSLASVPALDRDLRLHVRRVPGGRMSGWIHADLQPGAPLRISAARGSGYYVPDSPDQDLLLLGTGCGLAPLLGVVRDALHQGHRGHIALYHGSRDAAGLYLVALLRDLARHHPNLDYRPCVSDEPPAAGLGAGTPLALALQEHPRLAGWRVFLCGNPQMVEAARLETFLAGAASSAIHADPFLATAATPA
jgi:ferredoxin-NADP reductase/ferredoxin